MANLFLERAGHRHNILRKQNERGKSHPQSSTPKIKLFIFYFPGQGKWNFIRQRQRQHFIQKVRPHFLRPKDEDLSPSYTSVGSGQCLLKKLIANVHAIQKDIPLLDLLKQKE